MSPSTTRETSLPASGSADADEDDSRSVQILDAAMECFVHLGIARTSVQDVARMAGVSRGTVYRYFEDRNVLIEAAIEHGAQRFYRQAAEAMDKKATLADQAGAMAEVVVRMLIEQHTRNRLMSNDEELMRHMVAGSDATVRRTTDFLKPYVKAAKARGEVAANLDVATASEWLARMVNSLSTVQNSPNFDMSNPKAAGKFVARYAVNGLS